MLMAQSRPGPPGLGWQDFVSYWESQGIGGGFEGYMRQLAWYDGQVRSDDYVIGFTVFTAGASGGWTTYDVTNVLPKIAYYLVQAQ